MKKVSTIMVGSLLAIGIVISGMAFADNPGDKPCRGFASHKSHGKMGPGLLTRYQHENMLVQALSEITGQSEQVLREKLKDSRVRDVLEEYAIDREVFRAAMRAKFSQRVKEAAASGSITAEQEKDILTKMENRAQRHALMKQLIEKGVEDGTITQEQARMLLRRHFY